MLAIQASGLSKAFGGRNVFGKVDIEVAPGECIALTGCNGAGKTTLLRCLGSALRPTTGEVHWFGQPAAGNPQARRLIAMVGHETRLYPHLTVRENLLFAARLYRVSRPARRVDQLLSSIGLGPYAHRFPARISQGMRQRVAIVRALVHDPRILLFDEPFSGLDPQACGWLMGLLHELRAGGRTVCFTTHDTRKAGELADRVLHLRAGRVESFPAPRNTGCEIAGPPARAA